MIKGINHIGFVVKSIDATLEMLKKAFHAIEIERRSFPQLGQTSSIVQIGNSRYELMEPLGEEGVVPKYLKKNGEGFHHISLKCDDLDQAEKELAEGGISIAGRMEDTLFTNPKTSGGILYEVTVRNK